MDRFIVSAVSKILKLWWYLKSNMDRFIDFKRKSKALTDWYLKSNMDRFIAAILLHCKECQPLFKIQYG